MCTRGCCQDGRVEAGAGAAAGARKQVPPPGRSGGELMLIMMMMMMMEVRDVHWESSVSREDRLTRFEDYVADSSHYYFLNE